MRPIKAKGRRFLLDRRLDQITAAEPGLGHNNPPPDPPNLPDDDLLTSEQVGAWLGVSVQWLEVGRMRGYGPEYVRLGRRNIRYQRGSVKKFLRKRMRTRTREVA
jgi:hypothetical protein